MAEGSADRSGRGDGSTPGNTRTVERALRLLQLVATSENGVRLAAAARQVGLATSTAGRLMVTLEAMGFVWRDNDGYYRPGSQVLQLGAVAVHRMPLYQLAEPHLWRLANGTDETAYLAVLDRDGEHAMYLRQVESPKAIRHASWAGRAVRTAGTAVGAALLDRVGPDGYATSRNTIEAEQAQVMSAELGCPDVVR